MGEIYVHYIGKGLYDIDSFVKEAKKFGVARAIPPSVLKKFNWGDRIYLAQYITKEVDGKKVGFAKIFGYFEIEGINLSGSNELKERVRSSLNATCVGGGGGVVTRRCGSYAIGSVCYVKNDLKVTVETIVKTASDLGEKAKVFATGKLVLMEPIEVEAKFSRSVVKVEVDPAMIKVKQPIEPTKLKVLNKKKFVAHVLDYQQRKRLTKIDRRMLENKSLTQFL